MRRKQLDEVLGEYNTYRLSSTELCRKTFLWNINRLQRNQTFKFSDVQIRDAWMFFWLGYQKFGSWKV